MAALHSGNLIVEPHLGIAAVLPFYLWTGITGALLMASIWAYQKELRAAAVWVWRYRQQREERIAQRAADIAEYKQMKRVAEAIARLPEFASKRKRPATPDDERPQ